MKFRLKLTRRNLTAIVAVVLAAGLGAFVLLDLIFANQLTPARAASLLEKSSPELVSVLKTKFADDFSKIVQAAADPDTELTGTNQIARFLDDQTRPIAERYVDLARRAPSGLVANWMNKLAEAMTSVQKIAGAELCSSYVSKGQSVLTDKTMLAKLAPAFDARDAAVFAALAAARDAPASDAVGDAEDSDWQAVGAAMNGLEVPAGYGQIVASDDTKSPDYCSALAYYFHTVAALPGAAGQRIRAEYFVQSVS